MNINSHQKIAQGGFSLIELMVSLGLGALLLLGVLSVFDTNRQSSRMSHAFVEVQEGGRIATELLTRDIRMADFWGCMSLVDQIENHIDVPVGSDLDFANQKSVDHETANNTVIGGISAVQDSDILTLRTSSSMDLVRIDREHPPTSAVVKLVNINGAVIPQGTMVLLTDCDSADLFVTTKDTVGDGGNSELQISHNSGNNGEYLTNKNHTLSASYGPDTDIYQAVARRYFVGRAQGATVDSLYVQADGGVPEELVRRVTDMQLTYLVDTNADGSVDMYTTSPSAAQLDSALSVRVQLTLESSNSVANGAPLARNFVSTANIRNRML